MSCSADEGIECAMFRQMLAAIDHHDMSWLRRIFDDPESDAVMTSPAGYFVVQRAILRGLSDSAVRMIIDAAGSVVSGRLLFYAIDHSTLDPSLRPRIRVFTMLLESKADWQATRYNGSIVTAIGSLESPDPFLSALKNIDKRHKRRHNWQRLSLTIAFYAHNRDCEIQASVLPLVPDIMQFLPGYVGWKRRIGFTPINIDQALKCRWMNKAILNCGNRKRKRQ